PGLRLDIRGRRPAWVRRRGARPSRRPGALLRARGRARPDGVRAPGEDAGRLARVGVVERAAIPTWRSRLAALHSARLSARVLEPDQRTGARPLPGRALRTRGLPRRAGRPAPRGEGPARRRRRRRAAPEIRHRAADSAAQSGAGDWLTFICIQLDWR